MQKTSQILKTRELLYITSASR